MNNQNKNTSKIVCVVKTLFKTHIRGPAIRISKKSILRHSHVASSVMSSAYVYCSIRMGLVLPGDLM